MEKYLKRNEENKPEFDIASFRGDLFGMLNKVQTQDELWWVRSILDDQINLCCAVRAEEFVGANVVEKKEN